MNKKEAELHLKNPASIYLIQNICLSLLDIVNNPLSYFLCTVFGTIGHLNFRCTYVFIQLCINRLTNQRTFFLAVEVFK